MHLSMPPAGCRKILTFGFDDAEIHDERLADLFRAYGMKATFFLIAGQLSFRCDFHRYGEDTVVQRVSAEQIPCVYRGMEVASHTMEHRCEIDQLDTAVGASLRTLSACCGYPVRGLAYPGGVYTPEHVRRLPAYGVAYARTTQYTQGLSLPDEPLAWNPTCRYDDPQREHLAEEFLQYDGDEPALLYIAGHSYELTRKQAPYDWASFEELLRRLSGRPDVWYATNLEIVEWLRHVRSHH